MPLDPAIAAQVAHLFDATLTQLLSGEVDNIAPGPPMDRDDVVRADGEVAGPGGPIAVRTYRPVDGDDALPAMVWAHGGGWHFGSIDMPEGDSVCQVLAATGLHVVNVEYRLAPAHRHPAGLDDLAAVVDWLERSAEHQRIDPGRIGIGGASAGGHLALCTALHRRDAGKAPAALWLAYPVVDPEGGPYPDEIHPDCPPVIWLDADGTGALFRGYAGTDSGDEHEVPGRSDPTGLPPTVLTTAEVDGLTDQGIAWAERARASGVEVHHHHVHGVLHGYLNTVGGPSSLADVALRHHVDAVARLLGA